MDENEELEYYRKTYGPIIEKRGFHNWKNLFKKPSFSEWIVLFMLIMGLFLAWAYKIDIKSCEDFVQNITENSCYYCNLWTQEKEKVDLRKINNFSFIFKEDNLTNIKSGGG